MKILWISSVVATLCAACSEKPAPMPVPAPAPAPPLPPAPDPAPSPAPEPLACNAVENKSIILTRSRVQPRIVGGAEAAPGAYPWMAAIGYYLSSGGIFNYCGGTLIGSKWVLTAAHCQVVPGDRVTIGQHDLSAGGVSVAVKRSLIHAEYDPTTNHNDIALLELAQEFLAPDTVAIGVAPQAGTVRALGWGRTSEGGPASSVLMEVDLPIVSNAMCKLAYSDVWDKQMCAGVAGRDSCQGDSGGPLLHEGKQVGVVSYGVGCARPDWPGVYTRISEYIPWIAGCTR